MKILFVFDTFLLRKDNNDYYGMTLNKDFFEERYLKIFDELIVATRCKNINVCKGDISGYKIVNGEKIDVNPIFSYNSMKDLVFKRKKIKRELEILINKVDAVIIRMPSVLGILASKICKRNNKKYLIEMVACPWDGYINHVSRFGKIVAPFMWFWTKKVVYNAKNVLYVTNAFLQKRYPTKGNTCACSDVVLPQSSPNTIINRLKKIEKTDFKNLTLGTVANVELKYKGHEFVFRAIAKLKKRNINCTYYLIGNGDNSRLKKLAQKLKISSNIIFVGSLTHKEIFESLEKIDIYIQPSLQEGLPRALIEAMSVGVPCVGSNAGGIPELIEKEYIFEKKNVRKVCNILSNLDINKLKKMSEANMKISENYSREVLDKIRNDFYLKSLKGDKN